MAIRLATLATVPVKRSWSAVNPVSNGEPLCAIAAMGKRSGSATIRIVGHQRQRCFSDSASEDFLHDFWVWHSEIICGIIGTSDGPEFLRHVPEVSAALLLCPRLLVYGAIALIYGQLCQTAGWEENCPS